MASKVAPAVYPIVFDLASEGDCIAELQRVSETLGKAFIVKERDKNGCTLLHHAVASNQTMVMNYLIENGINLDAINNEGNTALHLAVQDEVVDAIHILLRNGAKDSLLNKEGKAPVHLACLGKSNTVLTALLKYDIDITVIGHHKYTPMHIIAECDNLEGCKLFHAKVQSINTKRILCLDLQNENGLTPCHLAARANSFHVLNFILDNCKSYGYPIETVLGSLDRENSTPLHTAVDKGNTETIQILLRYGASPTCTNHVVPPLHLACSQGRMDMVQLMVDHTRKEILSQPDLRGRTPLHYCAYSVTSSGIVTFIAQRVNSDGMFDKQDDNGDTPLHKAVEFGNLPVTKCLISEGANPRIQNSNGENVLHVAAAKRKQKEFVKELLQLPYITELCIEKDHCGFTAIHTALKSGDSDLISAIVEYEQLHSIQDENGNSYLHLAAENGNHKALKVLLDSSMGKQDLNRSNKLDSTPLHLAAISGNSSCVHLLLQRGAMAHKCVQGKTPLMLACKGGHTELARLLYEAHSFQINWKDSDGNTALHFAASSENPSMIEQILNINSSVVCQNAFGETFFDLIITSKNQDNAMAVVNHDRWQECLDTSSSPVSSVQCSHHPTLSLIKVMPDVANAILDRCHMRSSGSGSQIDSDGELFDFKYVYCTQANLAPLNMNETTSSPSLYGPSDSQPTLKQYANVQPIVSPQQKHHIPSMKVLQAMIQYKRVTLLSHPVVSAYLKMKWRNYGTPVYIASFICLILLVAFLSGFVLVVPNPSKQASSSVTTIPMENSSNSTESSSSTPRLSTTAQALRIVALIFNVLLTIHFVFGTVGLGLNSLNCIRYIQKWIYALGLICNYVFLLTPNPLDIWPIGSLACFLSWFMLILSMEFLGVIGLYVEMFTTVLRTVIQVLFICFFLLMAFAFSFYVLAASFPDFSNIGYSLFTMIGYMVGDISYSTFVAYDIDNSPYGKFVLIFVVLVSILVTIVMVNLLVGLAVGDIERVKQNALLQQRTAEIEMFTSLDKGIPRQILCCLNQPTYTIKFTTQSQSGSRFKQILLKLWQAVSDDVNSSTLENTQTSNGNESQSNVDNETKKELVAIKEEVIKLKEILQQLQIAHLPSVQAEDS